MIKGARVVSEARLVARGRDMDVTGAEEPGREQPPSTATARLEKRGGIW